MAGDDLKDGGPAFPRITGVELYASEYAGSPPSVCVQHDEGMSLRDWFAGKALAGVVTDADVSLVSNDDIIARRCYEMADAMLKARARR